MAGVTYFIQECPTCGRRLQVRLAYLGKRVACHHCGAKFAACDPQSPESPMSDSSGTLLSRVDQLLEASARRDTVAVGGPLF
jgi:ribosomal protein L37AE/L43A